MVTQLVIVGQYQYHEERNMEDNIVVFVGYQRFKCIGSKNVVTEDHQKRAGLGNLHRTISGISA
jgi:hypothetical protein